MVFLILPADAQTIAYTHNGNVICVVACLFYRLGRKANAILQQVQRASQTCDT